MVRLGVVPLGVMGFVGRALAQDVLVVDAARLDPPTLVTLGVQVLISGDANRNARIEVRYRKRAGAEWLRGLDLWRVRAEVVVGRSVPNQFAGSIFNLLPDTDYELELHAIDPDGLDQVLPLSARTRAVPPVEPLAPNVVNVSDAAGLQAALDAASAGSVITLAPGNYTGQFVLQASGTNENPIFVRGAATKTTILDGGGADSGNIFEIYGSFVTLERLTLQNLDRALRFQGLAAQGNVVRRVHIKNVRLGIGANPGQQDFYLCDNVLEGRLAWPAVYGDDAGAHANDDGILVMGTGHVVCHNRLIGFGDALKTAQDGARAVDFYGNETLSAYDNAVELDGAERNVRVFRNRFTNSWSPLSFQPIFGGPAYAFRNVALNIVDEQQKLHSRGDSEETVGALLYHNTFVSAKHAMNLQTSATAHDFELLGNLYVGPAAPEGGRSVEWSAPVDNPHIDWNGWFGDGEFDFDAAGTWSNFEAMRSAGSFETHGTLLDANTFASGLGAPADYLTALEPPDVTLAVASRALDSGPSLANISSAFEGAGPDLGAWELGCSVPVFGVRPEGMDESNEPTGCLDPSGGTGGGGAGGGGAGGSGGDGGASGNAGVGGMAGEGGASGEGASGGDGGSGALSGAGAAAGGGNAGAAGAGNGGGSSTEGGCGCRLQATPSGSRSAARLQAGALLALLGIIRRTRRKTRSALCVA